MSGYSTIQFQELPVAKSFQWQLGVAACVLGFVAGLAITSSNALSLFSVQTAHTTRAIPAVTAVQPSRYVQAVQASAASADGAQAERLFQAVPAVQLESSSQLSLLPLAVLGAGLATAAWLVKQFQKPSLAMMSTTAVKRAWVAQSGKKYEKVQPIIAPSLLAADLANLAHDSKRVMDAGADVLHVDVMDGHFVPNLSWGAPVVKCLRQHSNAFFDTHLMVSNPEDFIKPMADAGVDQFTFHIEAAKDVKGLIKAIKDAGMKVGISVKPKTPIDVVYPYVNDVDLILVMTVEPGFGGQSFMEDMMPKVKALRERYPTLDIQVDGGLSPATIDAAAKAGANAIVAGSACFVADPKGAIDAMRNSVEKYCTGPGK